MNIVYDDKVYNEDRKNEYVNDQKYKTGTKKILNRIFKITHTVEEELSKDLCEFNRDELRRTFYLFMASTPNASRGNVQYVLNYIDWCIEKGFKKGLNPLNNVDMKWKEQFVITQNRRFWTEEELNEIIDSRVNDNDAVIISLLTNGVRGHKNSEITNLTREDVLEETNQLRVTDEDKSQRIVNVTKDCVKLCIRASLDLEYEKMNGNPDDKVKAKTNAMVNNRYVVKSSLTRTINFDDADHNIVYRRLSTIAAEYNESHLTPANIHSSGMLIRAKNYLLEHGTLDQNFYKQIGSREAFNLSEAVVQRLKGDFLNEEYVRELYKLS